MTEINVTDSKIIKYQFEVNIARAPGEVWPLMTEKIDAWWMNDFRALGEDSTVSLSPRTGGLLLEKSPGGGTLEWYKVQMCTPGAALYLVGYMAPDWGGPTISMLKLGLEEREQGSALIVSDALMGNVTESSAKSAASGWETLFGGGFKDYAQSLN
jgi:uncharacterized protein YndB with AHSA1/START domain